MRVILTTFGTRGDNAPMFALAEALRAQGDEPLLLFNPLYEAEAAARELPFIGVGQRWVPEEVANAEKYVDPIRGAVAIWNDFYLPNVAPTFHAVRCAIADHRAEVVVSHWLSFGACFAACHAGVKHAVVNLAPCWWYSRRDPSVYSPIDAPTWMLRFLLFVPRLLVNRVIGGSLRSICSKLGVPWRRDQYFAALREANSNLGLWSPTFRPPASDDPPKVTLCGFPRDVRDSAHLAPELERFLDSGPPPVVVGLGSSMKTIGGDLYREVGLACRDLGCRVVLIGTRPEAASNLEGTLSVASAPYRLIFERARAIIHHGGIGTLAEAMRSGKPSAIVPFANDQYDNARRARRLGVALRWSRSRLRNPRLRKMIARLLEDDILAQKAAAFGAQLRTEPNGAAIAARAIAGGD